MRLYQKIKQTVFASLEADPARSRTARVTGRVLVVLILLNVTAAILQSDPKIRAESGFLLLLVNFASGWVFLVEYVCRVWVCNLHPQSARHGPLKSRLFFVLQPLALVDLLAALPLVLLPLLPSSDFTAILFLRLLRFLKIVRYSPALRSLTNAVVVERNAIIASLVIILGCILLAATLMFSVERHVQPEAFGSIPRSMWWAFATLTTVGYGDVVPVSVIGKALASLMMLVGYCLFALPVGIIGTAFVREIGARDFVVSWSMVAEIPMFQKLSAHEIKEISQILRSQEAYEGERIVHRGDPAHSMYIISSGRVRLSDDEGELEIGSGDHFGALELSGKGVCKREATAIEQCRLLVLDLNVLRSFLRRKPETAERIREAARAAAAQEKQRTMEKHDGAD
ncbi:cyclic nucleotide-gated ion channel [Polycladidibacter hongkongensis]|uniref:cyclic nucleotide-gated ion channel n=1 Tax=Polycladidibacter hongkongensis TaxID=1647556 RepID=UPI00155F47F1|nr:cyclic nucleotide-gated ion channel [Pseudovibrio hongkongensis]